MRSPTGLLVALIVFVLFVAFLADFVISLWDRFNAAMQDAARNLTAIGVMVADYAEPAINPRWGADQVSPVLMFILWIIVLALIVLVAEALRERRGGGADDE
jgi:uncharacterized membrane protein